MHQEIYPDEYGVDTWDPDRSGRVFVHLADSMAWREITGEEPPPTPVTARTYAEHGLPWYSLYDEGRGDLPAAERLKTVKTIRAMDGANGFDTQQDDGSIEIPEPQVVELGRPNNVVESGER